MHEVAIVVDYCTMWHRAKWYFTCVSNTWCLIIVPIINKINLFISELSQQIRMYEKNCHNYSNFAQSSMLFHRHEQHKVPITVPNMNKITAFFSKISQQTLKMYDKIAIISQMCHRAKFYFTCTSGPRYLNLVLNMNKNHPVIMEECMRIDWQMDGLTDWTLSNIPQFHFRVEQGIITLFSLAVHTKIVHFTPS